MVRASGQDAFRTPPMGGISGMPIREETPWQTKDTLERLNLPVGLGMFLVLPSRVGGSD